MAFNWTNIPDYVKSLFWNFTRANQLKENVYFNNEILSQWHDVDNTAAGNASGQGQSGQLRYGTGAGIFSSADTNGDLDSHKIWVDFSVSLTTPGIGTPVVSSIQLDDKTAAFGFDWKQRVVTIRGVMVDGDSNFPGGVSEDGVAFVSEFSDVVDTVARTQIGAATDNRFEGIFNSGTGRADGVPLTGHTTGPADLPRAGVILQFISSGPGATFIGFFHANNNSGAAYNDGDLIFTISSDDQGPGNTVDIRFIGTIECSGQRT